MLIQCPRLTPIQARLTVSLCTLGLLVVVYWVLSHTQFAYAAELHDATFDSREGSDHNWHRIEENILEEDEHALQGAGRSMLIPRASTYTIDANDSPNRGNVTAGQTNIWHYTQQLLFSAYANQTSALPSNFYLANRATEEGHADLKRREVEIEELERRQTSMRTVYLSINTCSQPIWSGSGEQDSAPPQLILYVGGSDVQTVGPDSPVPQTPIDLQEGFAALDFDIDTDIYLAVGAPQLSSNFTGGWTYDIALSIDDYYHASNTTVPFLYLVDTDVSSALLVTENLTLADANNATYRQWMNLTAPLPFTVFANNNEDTRRMGISQSYCGLRNIAEVPSLGNGTNNTPYVATSMVTRGLGSKPKQQFMIGNISASTTYNATLALVGNGVKSGKGVVGGGGTVWLPTNWTTKTDGNCQLLYGFDFCTDVAYAVPSNPQFNSSKLKSMYDDYAKQLYQNFTYSLMQIQCDTTNDQRYSLARNCDDCASAYKQWLCAVTIPRCEDFSNTAQYLQPRNVGQAFFQNNSMLTDDVLLRQFMPMGGAPTLPGSPIMQTYNWSFSTNQSRNTALIDAQIAPGPYKEVLPCEDICYNLVQSCPAALQFSCPGPGLGLEAGYAPRPSSQSVVQCNFPGAVYYIDNAQHIVPSMISILGLGLLAILVVAS